MHCEARSSDRGPAHHAAGRTGASGDFGGVQKPALHPAKTRRFSWCTSNGWATSAGHKRPHDNDELRTEPARDRPDVACAWRRQVRPRAFGRPVVTTSPQPPLGAAIKAHAFVSSSAHAMSTQLTHRNLQEALLGGKSWRGVAATRLPRRLGPRAWACRVGARTDLDIG
jgi:hypothetical protein